MDRYYTPNQLARQLLEKCSFDAAPQRVLDPSCGAGALIDAAEQALGATMCAGVDVDPAAIRSLRRLRPHWRLSVADLLCERSIRGSSVVRVAQSPDVLLLNPPFSQTAKKFEEHRCADGSVLRVGRAMLFLLRAIEIFQPRRGVFAIVPESMMFSQLDDSGRKAIGTRFAVRELAALKSTTFKGARVRSIAIELIPSSAPLKEARSAAIASYTVEMERGVLPVHKAAFNTTGAPFLHSSDLLSFVRNRSLGGFVEPGRTRKTGWGLFVPRVGVPSVEAIRSCYVRAPIRLSDCMIGLWCDDRSVATLLEDSIHTNWTDFVGLYRGTGARYITVASLTEWLLSVGIGVRRA